MPHPRFIGESYRIYQITFRVDHNDNLIEELTVQVFAEDGSEMDILSLDLVIPPGQKTALKATIDARLSQLESETGWTRKQRP